jgi:hypothetical protein
VEVTKIQLILKMSKINDQKYMRMKEFKYPQIFLTEDNDITIEIE